MLVAPAGCLLPRGDAKRWQHSSQDLLFSAFVQLCWLHLVIRTITTIYHIPFFSSFFSPGGAGYEGGGLHETAGDQGGRPISRCGDQVPVRSHLHVGGESDQPVSGGHEGQGRRQAAFHRIARHLRYVLCLLFGALFPAPYKYIYFVVFLGLLSTFAEKKKLLPSKCPLFFRHGTQHQRRAKRSKYCAWYAYPVVRHGILT